MGSSFSDRNDLIALAFSPVARSRNSLTVDNISGELINSDLRSASQRSMAELNNWDS